MTKLTLLELEDILRLEQRAGLTFLDHQRSALEDVLGQMNQGGHVRLCLYHRTGAGKTITSLSAVALTNATEVLVVAPPIIHQNWVEVGAKMGLAVTPVSHAKFRMKDFKVRRDQAIIVDEFHLLGGHTGKGWQKLDRMARGLQAPLIIASATPNYNDAERVYCIKHVLDPHSCKGGFLQFLYTECITEENYFSATPNVVRFKDYDGSAEQYLRHMPKVHYLPDEAIKQITIADVDIHIDLPRAFTRYGLDPRVERIVASQMEERHVRKRLQILDENGRVREEVYEKIAELVGQVATPTLIFCHSAQIARALHYTAVHDYSASALLITGNASNAMKQETVKLFIDGGVDVLIGTATLATGTDGIDKMCDHLLIVDDTDDDAQRRQLIGRILPRGTDADVSKKIVTRLNYL